MTEWRDLVTRLAVELEQLADHHCFHGGFQVCPNLDCVRRRRLLAVARIAAPTYVCAGRALDDGDQPIGEPCGKTFRIPTTYAGDGQQSNSIVRAAGWKLGPVRDDGTRDVICPRCAKPQAAVVKLCDDLTASIGGTPDA